MAFYQDAKTDRETNEANSKENRCKGKKIQIEVSRKWLT